MWFLKKLFKGSKDNFNIPSMSPPVGASSNYTEPEHIHQWEIVMKTYAPPHTNININSPSPELLQKTLFGITTLLFKCVLCPALKQEEVLGTDEQPLDQLLEKVEIIGPQYIQKEGVTFVVAKYQPPIQQSANLPLR